MGVPDAHQEPRHTWDPQDKSIAIMATLSPLASRSLKQSLLVLGTVSRIQWVSTTWTTFQKSVLLAQDGAGLSIAWYERPSQARVHGESTAPNPSTFFPVGVSPTRATGPPLASSRSELDPRSPTMTYVKEQAADMHCRVIETTERTWRSRSSSSGHCSLYTLLSLCAISFL